MCTDQTKQDYIFLLALEGDGPPVIEAQLRRAMQAASQELYGTDYYVSNPNTMKELCRDASLNGLARREGAGWRITPEGRSMKGFKYAQYIAPLVERQAGNLVAQA